MCLFSQVCNGDQYVHLSGERMQELHQRKQVITQTPETTATLTQQENSLSTTFAQDGISYGSVTLSANGASIQVETLPVPILEKVEKFYICCTCGKVFWHGSHFERVCEQFEYVLTERAPPQPSNTEMGTAETCPTAENSETVKEQEGFTMTSSAVTTQTGEVNREAREITEAQAAETMSAVGRAPKVVDIDDFDDLDDFDSEDSYDGFVC